jgi:hypothetical protein
MTDTVHQTLLDTVQLLLTANNCNSFADVYMRLGELTQQHMPELVAFNHEVMGVIGCPDLSVSERLNHAPKADAIAANKTS